MDHRQLWSSGSPHFAAWLVLFGLLWRGSPHWHPESWRRRPSAAHIACLRPGSPLAQFIFVLPQLALYSMPIIDWGLLLSMLLKVLIILLYLLVNFTLYILKSFLRFWNCFNLTDLLPSHPFSALFHQILYFNHYPRDELSPFSVTLCFEFGGIWMLRSVFFLKMLAQGCEVLLNPYFQLAHLFDLLTQGFQMGLSLAEVLFEMKKLTLVVLDLLTETVLQIECSSHVLDVSVFQYFCWNVVLINFLPSLWVQFLLVHDVAVYLQVFGSLHALCMMTLNMVDFFSVLFVDDSMVEYQSFLLHSLGELLEYGYVFLLICDCDSLLQPIELSSIHRYLLLDHLQDWIIVSKALRQLILAQIWADEYLLALFDLRHEYFLRELNSAQQCLNEHNSRQQFQVQQHSQLV